MRALQFLLLTVVMVFPIASGQVSFRDVPFEDAAMLMRYSVNVAHGHGVVWNVGDKPVDGATDFLFMLMVALLVKLGMGVETAVRMLGIAAHFGLVMLVYYGVRKLYDSSGWLALFSALYVAVGPGLAYVNAGFGTTVFAFFATATYYLAALACEKGITHRRALMFAASALITALVRPEGVLLAVFILLAVVYYRGARNASTVVAWFAAVFAVLGGFYFVWRWNYFGHPLPNPFYKKGGGHLYLGHLKEAVRFALQSGMPFIPAIPLAFRSTQATRRLVFALIPVCGFVGMWVLLSNEMNYLHRFQYPVIPLLAISWASLVMGLSRDLKLVDTGLWDKRIRLAVVGCFLLFGLTSLPYGRTSVGLQGEDGRRDVGARLSALGSGYSIATTEAGLLPLYSGWRALDVWGLNDAWIARHGQVTCNYLKSFGPDVIMVHRCKTIAAGWEGMVDEVERYANTAGFDLVAAFGLSPNDVHCYYVRRGLPNARKIEVAIKQGDYWLWGKKCGDYASSLRRDISRD